jgi:hypothetical protein
VLERVIENWLINSREREYQLAFCQVLAAEAQTVLYISPHSQLEHGRDIVTVEGQTYRGYQLKAGKGNFTQADWQAIHHEVDQLVRFRFHHPSCIEPVQLEPFLVTTKRLTDPASSAIAHENELWAAAGFKKLRVIELDELVKRFMSAHGHFFPGDPVDLDFFLRMYIKDGASPLDKDGFARFLEGVLGFAETKITATDAKSAVGAGVIFASYLLGKHTVANNHWALFEGWAMTLLYALAVQVRFGLPEKVLLPSIELCRIGVMRALDDLWTECKVNSSNFVQGDPLVDGLFWRSRMNILLGLVSIRYLILANGKDDLKDADEILAFVRKYIPDSRIPSEGGVPFLYAASVCLERLGERGLAASIMASLLASLVHMNGSRGERGLPNPYYGVEDASRLLWGLEPNNSEVFSGGSYMAEPLVHFLVRRGIKGPLEQLWEPLTFLNFMQSRPQEPWQWLVWRATDAPLQMTRAGRPQSWTALKHDASSVGLNDLPDALVAHPYRVLLLAVVMPQRFGKELAFLIDANMAKIS